MPKAFDAIFFDLDGTLLPMDLAGFTDHYFQLLANHFECLGVDSKPIIHAVMHATQAMIQNDGTCSNAQRFRSCFMQEMGEQAGSFIRNFDGFYNAAFHQTRAFTQPNPDAVTAVAAARKKASHVVLATNPLFPAAGIQARLSWIGLHISDFDCVTTYENASFCKPNPAYYTEIIRILGLTGNRILMIGNDVREDAQAAQEAGLETYLVTDCLIRHGLSVDSYACGSFSQMLDMLLKA